MKVTVIVPVYNEEKYISQCLKALTNQTESPDEIIVVNNNSSDQTVELVKQYNVKIVDEKQQGMSYARTRGFNEAEGDIIARCDADSIAPTNWIARIKYDFSTYKIDAVSGPIEMYDFAVVKPFVSNLYFLFLKIFHQGHETLLGPNMAITKNVWNKIKDDVCLDNTKVHEDIDMAIHINRVGGIILRDKKLIMKTSGRRITKNPLSFFIEYPSRLINTFRVHS